MKFNFISYFFIFFIIIILLASIISYASYSNISFSNKDTYSYYFSNDKFFWPVPGFNTITSGFGTRTSPTTGASSNHSGIDVSAPEGTNIYSAISGEITSIGFQGANGYSIVMESNDLTIIYAHVSPNYIVSIGDYIYKGEKIGNVGPKYISSTQNNPYTDSTGNSTNGATTGPHLHLTIKIDGIAVNPLDFFN